MSAEVTALFSTCFNDVTVATLYYLCPFLSSVASHEVLKLAISFFKNPALNSVLFYFFF